MNSFNPALMAAEIGTVTIWLASVRKVRWGAMSSIGISPHRLNYMVCL